MCSHQLIDSFSQCLNLPLRGFDFLLQPVLLTLHLSDLQPGVAIPLACALGAHTAVLRRLLVELVRQLLDPALEPSGRRGRRTRRIEGLGLQIHDANVELLDLFLKIGLQGIKPGLSRDRIHALTLRFSSSEFSTRVLPNST